VDIVLDFFVLLTKTLKNVVTSIAGRKQLKHKSRLYDLRTDNEVDINDYNSDYNSYCMRRKYGYTIY